MTRYKRYIRDCGYNLEHDYDWLPWKFGNCTLIDVFTGVTPYGVELTEVYDAMTIKTLFTPDGVIHE